MNDSYLTQGVTIIVLGGLIFCMWRSIHLRLAKIELRLILDSHGRRGGYNNPHKYPNPD